MATIEITKQVKICDRCRKPRRLGMYSMLEHARTPDVRTSYEICAPCTSAFEKWITLAARRASTEQGE